jgi:uncharacterized protein YggE
MKNNLYKIVLLSLALVLFTATLYVYRPTQNNLTRVTVLGESHMRVAPDSAAIVFSVVTQNAQAVTAQQENARKSEAVINAVKIIASNAEIKTTDYNLQPEQDYSARGMPKIVGYNARNSVKVTINDMNQTGAVIDAATKAGANAVEGVSFVVRENSPARGDALAMATRQAMIKAGSIAQSLDGRIIRVVETIEGGINSTNLYPIYNSTAAMSTNTTASAARSYTTPVEAGSLNVNSQVILVVEIEVKK